MARLSYKGTKRQCKQMIRGAFGIPHRCTNSASRGSDYCLKHKHLRSKRR